MSELRIKGLLVFMCLIMGSCTAKKQWQGQYSTITYTKYEPKEDFKVLNFVVVSFDIKAVDKHSGILYRFEIWSGGKKKGALELCKRSFMESISDFYLAPQDFEYALMAGRTEGTGTVGFGFTRRINKTYIDLLDYETLKKDVTVVLSGE
jgi:hypothetical protein